MLDTPGALTRSARVAPYVDYSALDLVGVVRRGAPHRPPGQVLPPRPTPSPAPARRRRRRPPRRLAGRHPAVSWSRAGLFSLLVLTARRASRSACWRGCPRRAAAARTSSWCSWWRWRWSRGRWSGSSLGFGAGSALDLVGDHPLGLLALVFCLVGYVAGQLKDSAERSTLAPLVVVAAAAVGAAVLYALLAFLTGDPRATLDALAGA